MGQNNQKDQKGPKMTAAVMLVQNNQNNQKIWSSQISYTILKVRFFWDTLYNLIWMWISGCNLNIWLNSDLFVNIFLIILMLPEEILLDFDNWRITPELNTQSHPERQVLKCHYLEFSILSNSSLTARMLSLLIGTVCI